MVTPDVGVQGTWRTPAAGKWEEWKEPLGFPGPQIDVFGPEITHSTAASVDVSMKRASLICAIHPTFVPSSKYQQFQMSGDAVVRFSLVRQRKVQ
jgi:hypothetical protein